MFLQNYVFFEKKSTKLNLTRISMKLFFSELGKNIFKIFTIIWAFTAFWAINNKEMRAKINQYQILMRFSFVFSPIIKNLSFVPNTSIPGYFKSQISKYPSIMEILPHELASRLPFYLDYWAKYNKHTVSKQNQRNNRCQWLQYNYKLNVYSVPRQLESSQCVHLPT